jgi:hypothetical protein
MRLEEAATSRIYHKILSSMIEMLRRCFAAKNVYITFPNGDKKLDARRHRTVETRRKPMKHRKTVSEAVWKANRDNSKHSTGPGTRAGKSRSSHNALRHGILARRVELDTHEERAERRELRHACETEFSPLGLLEEFLVEEITAIFWKLGITEGLQAKELLRRQELSDGMGSDGLDNIFHKDLELPINGHDLPLNRGWDCERLVVRAVSGKDTNYSSASRGPAVVKGQVVNAFQNSQNSNSQSAGHLEFEAVLGNSLSNMTRYQSALKRDLYKAIETLRKIQAERREREK